MRLTLLLMCTPAMHVAAIALQGSAFNMIGMSDIGVAERACSLGLYTVVKKEERCA